MAKLTLTSDEGEVLEIWNVTSNAGRDGGVYTDGDFNVSVSFARTQLVDEIRQEVEKYEARTYLNSQIQKDNAWTGDGRDK